MAIEHDQKFLYGGIDYGGPYITDDDCIRFAREYHEHMMRWRSPDELPENNSEIEVVCKINHQNAKPSIKRGIFKYEGSFKSKYFEPARGYEFGVFENVVSWRPAGRFVKES